MRRGRGRIWALTLAAALPLSACGGQVSEEHVIDQPVTVEEIEGTEIARVTLKEPAVERADIQTAPVERIGGRLIVPFSAVLVDPEGTFWVYTSPEPRVYVRHEVGIDRDEGDRVFLTEGPPPGTSVVTVGVPELYGAETGVGK